MLFYRKLKAKQQLARTRFRCVTVVLGKLRFEIGRAHIVFITRLCASVNGITLGHGFPHFGMAHEHNIKYTLIFKSKLVLTQLT